MKNFILGVALTLVVGLWSQNQSLRRQIVASNNTAPKVSKSVARAKVRPVKVQTLPQKQIVLQQTADINYGSAHDPRCPDHLPYYDGRWGCVVKRP